MLKYKTCTKIVSKYSLYLSSENINNSVECIQIVYLIPQRCDLNILS